MKRGILILLLVSFLLLTSTFAQLDAPIQKLTNYAEQYEIGNINYAQLIIYITSLQEEMAEEMGATSQGHDAVLTVEQLESSLGAPTESTKWVWVEGEEREKKLDKETPTWRKIIFDGKKIQIWLNAWPNIISKNNEEKLIYRLHLDINFKKQEEQIDIKSKIEEIKAVAENYKENSNSENLEILAKESVAAEQLSNSYFSQSPGKCEEVMNDLFGTENRRENRKTLVEEITFYEGENFETMLRLEMCDDCDWAWINLNMWFNGRGNFQHPDESVNYDQGSKGKYESLSDEDFKKETTSKLEEIKTQIAQGDYQSAILAMQEFRILTGAWDEKANNVWEQIEDKYRVNFDSMTQEEREECSKNYCWIKKDQERIIAEKELRNKNYQDRKEFYSNLFSSYEKKEFYYEQEEWEKRLVEDFKEFGEEICSNNVDDNNNNQIDCSDSQCGGKVCGYDILQLEENNTTTEQKIELYCISGSCQQKEEIFNEKLVVCGNHVCEENEQETCLGDCTTCFEHAPLECTGNVIFSGEDEKGCPLEPICLAQQQSCTTDEDCINPLCGTASCIDNTCQVTELTGCKEAECVDGQEKIQNCESGESLVTEKCIEGLWIKTDIACEVPSSEIKEPIEEIVKEECVVKSDCGNDNDVCSNGKCVTLPESIDEPQESVDVEKIPENEQETVEEQIPNEQEVPENENEPSEQEALQESKETIDAPQEQILTGEITRSFFRSLTDLTGFTSHEGEVVPQQETTPEPESQPTEEQQEPPQEGAQENPQPPQEDIQQPIENEPRQENIDRENEDGERREEERREEDNKRREQEEQKRRESDCNERCTRECYDSKIRPCTEKCIREECGNELECNIDDTRISCESKCESENDIPVCKEGCFNKCIGGEETWEEPQREEHKEEKFVFTAGGSCRNSQGREEGSIWFGGWGENFNEFHLIKSEYYANGNQDWCERDIENLLKQRKELEKSMNDEFAYWFFEKYVANSAEDWENHISGIFDLYWRDVDISRQIAERSQCLKKDISSEQSLISFNYKTDYGSVEFWEEIKTAKLNENGPEVQIVSPYMKTWLFPSRDFFKAEMKKSMEMHRIPGPPEQETKNTLTEEEKRMLMEDEEFIESVKNFNRNYGENLVVQFKDFETGEVAFNIYMRINEEELIYFEPMLPSEIPAQDVKIEFDVNKLLDIIEYEETGRIELESPPWDKQPRTGVIKNIKDEVTMFYMFMSLMNSAQTNPESAKGDAKLFVRNFFETVMGDGENHEPNEEIPEFNKENIPEDWKEEFKR